MNGNFDMETFGVIMAAVMMIIYLAAIGLSLAQYITFALGLYDTACKRGIPHAWTAWLPLVGHWMLGAVVDHFAERRGGKRRWGKVMLVICIAVAAGYVLLIGVSVSVGVVAALAMEDVFEFASIGWTVGMIAAYTVLIVACIAYAPCYAVCLYKIYEELVPEKAVKYLLLSFLVPLAVGICMLRCGRVPVEAASVGIEAPRAEDGFVPQDPFAQNNTEE